MLNIHKDLYILRTPELQTNNLLCFYYVYYSSNNLDFQSPELIKTKNITHKFITKSKFKYINYTLKT